MYLQHLSLALAFALATLSAIAQEGTSMPATTTTIEWAETKHDFGDIEQQDRVTHIFKFTNVGDAPLVILSAKGSCGCTVPHWPKVPVLPGESSEIEVMFDSTGKIGRISKRIAVVANTSPGRPANTFSIATVSNDPPPAMALTTPAITPAPTTTMTSSASTAPSWSLAVNAAQAAPPYEAIDNTEPVWATPPREPW